MLDTNQLVVGSSSWMRSMSPNDFEPFTILRLVSRLWSFKDAEKIRLIYLCGKAGLYLRATGEWYLEQSLNPTAWEECPKEDICPDTN